MNFSSFLIVGAGGAIGSMMRYGIALLSQNKYFPYHTFIVNLIGSFFIGAFLGLLLKKQYYQRCMEIFSYRHLWGVSQPSQLFH